MRITGAIWKLIIHFVVQEKKTRKTIHFSIVAQIEVETDKFSNK